MKNLRPEDLQYSLLPSANPPPQWVELHNRAFTLWHGVWESVLRELKFDTSGLVDDFIRQDLIACIHAGSEPVAIHLYTFFSIDAHSALEHGYMKQYPELFFQRLKREGVRNVMSLEYMTVHPDWRKGKCPVHLGAVLVGLGMQVMELFQQDASIAPARRDHKVNEIAYAFGGQPVVANVMNHNVACDLLACYRKTLCPHPTQEVRAFIDSLWSRRSLVPGAVPTLQEAKVLPIRPLRNVA